MGARLTIVSEAGVPVVYDLSPEEPATLGRHRSNTVVLRDEHASRWHAQIVHEDGHWVLREIENPRNGTKLNGQRIRQQSILQDGSEISIGDTRLRFTLTRSGKSTARALHGARTPTEPQPTSSASASGQDTSLLPDALTALFSFVARSLEDSDPRLLVRHALSLIASQTRADVTGFLSLDPEDPLPKLVLPELARVDFHLSRQLTQRVQRDGRAVWLGATAGTAGSSDSLIPFTDALCVPLSAGGAPLGALHAYRSSAAFCERDQRFCEVLAGYLANSLHVLRVRRTLEAENSRLRVHSSAGDELVGDSALMKQLRQLIGRAAPRPSTVLIRGESGVGKELVALGLHRQSTRQEGPLVVVNCAAIASTLPEAELFGHTKGAFTGADRDRAGLFQQADEGTLFLDEVGELSLECQAKLLRVIEGKGFRPVGASAEVKVDVRIIAATNRDLEREVKAGKFREDLYFRLQVIHIPVPPLREHPEDIPALVEFFLDKLAVECRRQVKLTEGALRRLQAYSWPGNVRQLRSVLESAVFMSDSAVLDVGDLRLPVEALGQQLPPLNLEQLEAWAIRQALQQTEGNITQAAKLLGIVRDTLASKMKKYGVSRE